MGKNGNFPKKGMKGKKTPKDWDKKSSMKSAGSKSEAREDQKTTDRLSSLNDFSWYDRYPQLLDAAGRFPFPYKPGMEFKPGTIITGSGSTKSTITPQGYMIPGVMSLKWVPTVGWSEDVTSPASIAAKEIYAKVRSKFSGSLDADAPDFLVYIVALDSIFSYIGMLKRLYRSLDAYSGMNFNTPDVLLRAMGVPSQARADELRRDKAKLNYIINTLVRASRKFAMPNVMDYFNRHYWMNDNVYTDEATMNSQFYVFRQFGYYIFSILNTSGATPAEGETGASGLTMMEDPWESIGSSDSAVDYLYTYGNNMITMLASSEDAYTISGYLMRAYEGSEQFVVAELPFDEKLTPVYQPEVLAQIENSKGVVHRAGAAFITNFEGLNVWQNPATNSVLHMPVLANGAAGNTSSSNSYSTLGLTDVFSIRSDTPSVQDIVVASRLHPAYGLSSDGTGVAIYAASEIPLEWTVYSRAGVEARVPSVMVVESANLKQQTAVNNANLGAVLNVAAFDWAPLIVAVHVTGSTADDFTYEIVGDIHNVTPVDLELLRELNRVCAYSEFNAFSD